MLAILALLASAGCSTRAQMMTPEQQANILNEFRNGQTILDCDMACAWAWITDRDRLYQLYAAKQWDQLAERIAEIGYQEDLGYFWLGQAADAIGNLPAAYRYYSMVLAMQRVYYANVHCEAKLNGCYGIPIVSVANYRISAIRALAARPPPFSSPVGKASVPFGPMRYIPDSPAPVTLPSAQRSQAQPPPGWQRPQPASADDPIGPLPDDIVLSPPRR
jgi:hypothetical protein